MAGIAGILSPGKRAYVQRMLNQIAARGDFGSEIIETFRATIGVIWTSNENEKIGNRRKKEEISIGQGFGHQVDVLATDEHTIIKRGKCGVVPFYIAQDQDGAHVFASEMKAFPANLLRIINFGPGQQFIDGIISTYYQMKQIGETPDDEITIGEKIYKLLADSIERRIKSPIGGAWIGAGIKSAILTGMLKPRLDKLHTFATGMRDSEQLARASNLANRFGCKHHEIILDRSSIIKLLPDVIFQLESIDPQVIRSGVMDMCLAWAASEYVEDVFTSDMADELFADSKVMPVPFKGNLNGYLLSLVKKMHATALQSVDKSCGAFGITPHVVFADQDLIEYALSIPEKMKLHQLSHRSILSKAFQSILTGPLDLNNKAYPDETTLIGKSISEYADSTLSDFDLESEKRHLRTIGLKSKEQLLYLQIFKEQFGDNSYQMLHQLDGHSAKMHHA